MTVFDNTTVGLYVHPNRLRFREEPAVVGEDVFVTPRDSRLFVEDYQV